MKLRSTVFRRRLSSLTDVFANKINTFDLKQGDSLILNVAKANCSNITITSAWQDHCALENLSPALFSWSKTKSESTGISSSWIIDVNSLGEQVNDDKLVMSFTVPEYVNIAISSKTQLNLTLRNKIQGDCQVECQSGLINIDKLRGEFLDFQCGSADVVVHKSLEGNNTYLKCGSFSAKKVHGDSVEVVADHHVKVAALYSDSTVVNASADIDVGLLSGCLQAHSSNGNISLKSVDGQFNLQAERGTIRLQVNKLKEGSRSSAMADKASIIASVDPEMRATVLCESLSYKTTRAAVTIVSDAFEVDADKSAEITDSVTVMEGGRLAGRLTGKSQSLKRPTPATDYAHRSGKISLDGAEAQAMQSHGERRGIAPAGLNSNGPDDESSEMNYDLQLIANGNIRLETMSWIEAIRRKYGFMDEKQGTLPPKRLGRTASAGIRAASINPILKEE